MENVDIDYSRNHCGIFLGLTWNYPEAYFDAIINCTNVKYYYSAGNTFVSSLVWEPFATNNPGTMILTNFYSDIYSEVSNLLASFGYGLSAAWMDTTNDIHFMYIKDIYLTLSQPNYLATNINIFALELSTDIYRQQSISISKYNKYVK